MLLHVFDHDQCRRDAPWAPNDESDNGDRFSCALVNHLHPEFYTTTDVVSGLVLRSIPEVKKRILCSYPTDRGTVYIRCRPLGGGPDVRRPPPAWDDAPENEANCIPGCAPTHCDKNNWPRAEHNRPWVSCGYPTCQECAFHGSETLADMMRAQVRANWGGNKWFRYNEVILDSRRLPWVEIFPHAMEAFFVGANAEWEAREYTKQTHKRFLRVFKLTEAQVPLVTYSPWRHPPFSMYDD